MNRHPDHIIGCFKHLKKGNHYLSEICALEYIREAADVRVCFYKYITLDFKITRKPFTFCDL